MDGCLFSKSRTKRHGHVASEFGEIAALRSALSATGIGDVAMLSPMHLRSTSSRKTHQEVMLLQTGRWLAGGQ
jgi:hypothetical protein